MYGLLQNQCSAIEHLKEWKVGALFMEAGTGKTRVAIELVNSVSDVDLVVWVGPLNTIRTKDKYTSVVSEVSKWGGFNCPNVIFIGIESIQASDRIYLGLLAEIEKAKKAFVVVDESLKIKNHEAKRTKRLINISSMVEYKLLLNGTPLSKNLLDLWSQMQFLSPKILNMNISEFKNTFCEYTTVTKYFGSKHGYTKEFITGYANIDYLYSLIKHYIYECDLTLNILQRYHNIDYRLDDLAKQDYEYLKSKYLDDEMLLWKNNNIFLEMTQKMQHAYCCTEDKFNKLDELFEEIPQNKTIIFCKYIVSHDMCEKRYPKAKVLSYQKESLGLNLQEYSYTVYFDKIWDLALRVQSGRRTFRTGQVNDCQYYDFTGNVGLEALINANIEKKVSMTEYFKGKTKEDLVKVL